MLPGWGRQVSALLRVCKVDAHLVRVPLLPQYSWHGALLVAREADLKELSLMRIWESQDYCVSGGARSFMLARGSLRVCREWIAGYLGPKGEFDLRLLPAVCLPEEGPAY